MTEPSRPRVGISAVIPNPDYPSDKPGFLMGLRKGSHGANTWATPGGHLEHGESFFECAERETLEETGLRVRAERVLGLTNDFIPDGEGMKHYVTIYVVCRMVDEGKEPEVLEKEKCEKWEWYEWAKLREGLANGDGIVLFEPIVNLLGMYPELEKSLRD